MQALASHMMFTILDGYKGTEVSCLAFEEREYVEYRGILNEVLPFNGVRIDDDFVQFEVADRKFIKEIVSLEDNKQLYVNLDKLIGAPEDDYGASGYKGKGL